MSVLEEPRPKPTVLCATVPTLYMVTRYTHSYPSQQTNPDTFPYLNNKHIANTLVIPCKSSLKTVAGISYIHTSQ